LYVAWLIETVQIASESCRLQYLSAWNNYKFAIDHIVLMPKYRMKAQEIAKSEGLLDNKKRKDRTKTRVDTADS